jgi:hypothetical protein
MRSPVVSALFAASLASCASPAPKSEIAEWTLGAEPTIAIGGDDSTKTEFFNVSGAWRLPDGAIAVTNGGTNEIRVFDARGKFAYAFGRTGDGPGEFRQISWTGSAGDTAFLSDVSHRRVTTVLLDSAPRLLTTLQFTLEEDSARDAFVAGRLADGRWLLHGMSQLNQFLPGVHRLRGFAGLAAADGKGKVDWLGEAPDIALFIFDPSGNQKTVSVEPAAFAPLFHTAASGTSIWFGDQAADSLFRVDVKAGSREVVHLPDPPLALPKSLVDTARDEALTEIKDSAARAFTREKYRGPNLPSHLPAWEDLLPGPDGELWVQLPAVRANEPVCYVVLSAQGAPLARVTMPSGFRVWDAGKDYVVGVHRDADGVESIREYSLSR